MSFNTDTTNRMEHRLKIHIFYDEVTKFVESINNMRNRYLKKWSLSKPQDPIYCILWLQSLYWDWKDLERIDHPLWPDYDFGTFCHAIIYSFQDHETIHRDLPAWLAQFNGFLKRLKRCGAVFYNNSNQNGPEFLFVLNWVGSRWNFPMGKMIPGYETECECAKKEVYEETGIVLNDKDFDNVSFIDIESEDDYRRSVRLYRFNHVSSSIDHTPQTRNEIREVRWVSFHDLLKCKHQEPVLWSNVFKILEHPLFLDLFPEFEEYSKNYIHNDQITSHMIDPSIPASPKGSTSN